MSKRARSPTADSDPRPSMKQRRSPSPTSPTPRSPSPATHELNYPAPGSAVGPPPAFQQPTPLISFSYSPARELEFTDSALRYFVPPPRNAQLAYAYDRWNRRPEGRARIDGLLRALSAARAKRHPLLASGVGVVAWRGVITRCVLFFVPSVRPYLTRRA